MVLICAQAVAQQVQHLLPALRAESGDAQRPVGRKARQQIANRGELLSYLLFAEEFIERLIDLGRRDARRWLRSTHEDGRWQLGPLR